MAIDDASRFPPEPFVSGALTLVRNGRMQTDMDAQHYRILNLDTSNLILDELSSQTAPAHQWFNSYDAGVHLFGSRQPSFTDIGGQLTLSQQAAITRVGRIIIGEWRGTPLDAAFVPRLNLISAPAGSVDMAHNRIIHLADPIDDDDAVTLRRVNALASGIQPKAAVVTATTADIPLATLVQPVDGVTLHDNDRVLVKNQSGSRHYQNGIWLAHPGAWTRATDCDTVAELVNATVFVLGGNTNGTSTFLQVTPPPFGINFGDPAPFAEFSLFSTAIIAQAGAGLDQTGSTIFAVGTANRISIGTGIDIASNYVGQTSINTVGTIMHGEWAGLVIDGSFGGTGVANDGKSITLTGDFATQLSPHAAPDAIPENPLIFQLLGATTLTLPVVGTLATLAGNETFSNKHISAEQIDSGVLDIPNGGTNADNELDALNNLLPDQAGHEGQTLHTTGGTVYWA